MPLSTTQRDLWRRREAAQLESQRTHLRGVVRDTRLPAPLRQEAQAHLDRLGGRGSVVRVVRRCIVTGRGAGVLRRWRLSRHAVLRLAREGHLVGVIKHSW